MTSWQTFSYQNTEYCLSHLHPFSIVVTQSKKRDLPERSYTVNVDFSMHCFTVKDMHPPVEGLKYSDSRETRFFCFKRYRDSTLLPQIIREIGSKNCYHTPHDNFFLVELIKQDKQENREYEIYFKLSKAGKNKGLNLYIQSAYIRDESYAQSKPKKRKPIKFIILVRNIHENRPIRVPQ